jgi:hypothetical protein
MKKISACFFKDQILNEKKKIVYGQDDYYDGLFLDGKYHGLGIRKYPNGSVYVGSWRKGLRHGKGQIIERKGKILEGVWVDGVLQGRAILTKRGVKKQRFYKDGIELLSFVEVLADCSDNGEIMDTVDNKLLGALHKEIDDKYDGNVKTKEVKKHILQKIGFCKRHRDLFCKGDRQIYKGLADLVKKKKPILLSVVIDNHRMLFSIKYDNNGQLMLAIFNTGKLTNQWHLKHSTRDDKYAACFRVENVDEAMMGEEGFRDLAQVQKAKICSIHEFYAWVEEKGMAKNEGNRMLDMDGEEIIWQKEQESGSCSLKVWFAFMKDEMVRYDPENGLLAYYEVKLRLLREAKEHVILVSENYDREEMEVLCNCLTRKIEKRERKRQVLLEIGQAI